jgi:hypothetical protein
MAEARPKRERKPSKTFEELQSIPKPTKPRAKRSRKEPFPFEKLPDQVKTRIVSFLKAGGLCSSATVSKEWKKITEDDTIWGSVLLERFGHIFEDPQAGEDDSLESIIANWPNKKPFKEVYRDIYALESEKQEFWAQWASLKPSSNVLASNCPMCEGPLYLEKNDMPKREDEEDPPSEKIIQCKTPKCGFVLPYATCATCKQPTNMVTTFICQSDKCSKLSVPERIHCWNCAKECESTASPDRCEGWLCPNCICEVVAKKGKAHSCPSCCFSCVTCNTKHFNTDRTVCKKCKKVQCGKCAKDPGCGCAPSKSRRKAKHSEDEDEDEEFAEDEPASEEDDFEEDAASD